MQSANISLHLAKWIIENNLCSLILVYYKNSRSAGPTFLKKQVMLFPTRDIGGIQDFEYIIFLKSEKNPVGSQIGNSFQDVLLIVMFIGLSLKRYR